MAKKNSRPNTKTKKKVQKKPVRTKKKEPKKHKEIVAGEVAKLNNRILDRCKSWIIDQNASEIHAKVQPVEEIVIGDHYDDRDSLNEVNIKKKKF